jgi:hypothetical protein
MQLVKQTIIFILRDDTDVVEFLKETKCELENYEGMSSFKCLDPEIKMIDYPDSHLGDDLENNQETDNWYEKANEVLEECR